MKNRFLARAAAITLLALLPAGCVNGIIKDALPFSPSPPPPTNSPYAMHSSSFSSPSNESYESLNDTSPPTRLEETEDMGQTYIDKIIFLGDSTTYGLKYYAMLSGGSDTLQVWTSASGTLALSHHSFILIAYPDDGTQITIVEAVERKKPEIMIITLGVNGISLMDEAYFKSQYISLVESIQAASPDTKIILQSILPVSAKYPHLGAINNELILRANTWVLEAAEATGVRYLDTQSVLKDADGWLAVDYQNGDGIHLNETGFALVLEYISTHGYR